MNTFSIAALGLQTDADRLRVASHNVANLTTTGYKRQFAIANPTFANLIETERATQELLATQVDMSVGKLRQTGGELDVALPERQFLVVRGAAGDEALSRGGALKINGIGQLTTAEGAIVEGADGALVAPPGTITMKIDSGGQVFADDKKIGTLQVVSVPEGSSIRPLGEGLYASSGSSHLPQVREVQLQAGYTEASNVVPTQEMIEVMQTMRHAESMVKMLQGADEMMEKAIRKLGDVS